MKQKKGGILVQLRFALPGSKKLHTLQYGMTPLEKHGGAIYFQIDGKQHGSIADVRVYEDLTQKQIEFFMEKYNH